MNSTAPGSDPPALPPLDNTLGAMLLGTFAGLILEGLLIHQTVRYFRLYPNDTRRLKIWVSTILLVETLNCALNMHMCFHNMVVNYLNPAALLGNPVWSGKVFTITGCVSATLTESFFMRRVWLVGRKYRVLVCIGMVLGIPFFICYMIMLRRWNAPTLQEFLDDTWLATLGSGLFGCSDLMITCVLIHVLRKSRTGIKRTNWTLDVLVRYTFTTGFIITFFQVISILCSSLWPRTLIFLPINVILTKTAAMSMLISLNMRNWLGNTDVTDIDPMSPFTTSIKFQQSQQPAALDASTRGSRLGPGKVTQLQIGSSSRSMVTSEDIELGVLGDSSGMGKRDTLPDVLDIKQNTHALVGPGEDNV